jgi:hypothetical protein
MTDDARERALEENRRRSGAMASSGPRIQGARPSDHRAKEGSDDDDQDGGTTD